MDLKFTNKVFALSIMLSGGLALASGFVSIVDAKSSGGIAIIKESAEVGSIVLWGNNNPPEGWLILNGQKTTGYPELIDMFGDNLPNYNGLFIKGYGNGSGSFGVTQSDSYLTHNHTASFSGNALPPHTHSYYRWTGATEEYGNAGTMAKKAWGNYTSSSVSAGTPSGTVNINSSGNVETRPVNISFNYIIKGE